MRSFSVCSESSNLDMFGEDLGFGSHFKELSSMENDSHFFKNNQTEWNLSDKLYNKFMIETICLFKFIE
jgi:aspartyl/asparaginyl beta-hydroxylase (cupin superfamily)